MKHKFALEIILRYVSFINYCSLCHAPKIFKKKYSKSNFENSFKKNEFMNISSYQFKAMKWIENHNYIDYWYITDLNQPWIWLPYMYVLCRHWLCDWCESRYYFMKYPMLLIENMLSKISNTTVYIIKSFIKFVNF